MPPVNWNPGDFVFDQSTGEPYIDEDGVTYLVEPNLRLNAADGRTIEGDDVANAAWYRANKYEGETLRDRTIGVPYLRLALGQQDIIQAINVCVAEVRRRTPGVAGVVSVRALGLDPRTRILSFGATILRSAGGGDQSIAFAVSG